MRFLADENVSRLVVRRLEDAGYDIATIPRDQRGSPDETVLELAVTQHRILITEDRDFGELVIRRQMPVAGLVLLELDQLSSAAEAERVLSVVSQSGIRLHGSLVVVEPTRTRIRPLHHAFGE